MKFIPRVLLMIGFSAAAYGPACAGEWDCNRTRQFRLDVPSLESAQTKDSDRKWVESLVSNLREQGGDISAVDTLVQSDASLTLNGERSDCQVLQLADGAPGVFYVQCENLVVDFHSQRIIDVGVSGQSVHVSPSKNVAVLIHSTGHEISGVPVGPCFSPPHFLWNPWFSRSRVWWY